MSALHLCLCHLGWHQSCHQEGSVCGWGSCSSQGSRQVGQAPHPAKCLLQLRVEGTLNPETSELGFPNPLLGLFLSSLQFCKNSNEGPEAQVTVPGLTPKKSQARSQELSLLLPPAPLICLWLSKAPVPLPSASARAGGLHSQHTEPTFPLHFPPLVFSKTAFWFVDTHSPETLTIGDADVGFKKWNVHWLIPQCELLQQSQRHGVHLWTSGQLVPLTWIL